MILIHGTVKWLLQLGEYYRVLSTLQGTLVVQVGLGDLTIYPFIDGTFYQYLMPRVLCFMQLKFFLSSTLEYKSLLSHSFLLRIMIVNEIKI